MLKKEVIWREIIEKILNKEQEKFQQKQLAKKFGFSLSTINNALKIPRKAGAVKVTGRYFILENPEKMLMLWASWRNPAKDMIYQTFIDLPVKEMENSMPEQVIYGAYSAYLKKFQEAPADYDKVYVYLKETQLATIKQRFKPSKRSANLFVLKADGFLECYGKITPISQIFVDIWNLKDWYAADFYKSLKEKLYGILA